MVPVYNPQNASVFFIGVKGDVTIKDQSGNDIKLEKGDKIPADARIIVGDGGKIVFKQANKTLKYESRGEASLSNALTESSDATLDPEIKNLVEAAEQISTTPDRPSEATPAQQPLAKPVTRPDASTLSPTPAKQGISDPPAIVHADRGEARQPDATEIVAEMAEQVATRSDAIRASTTETEAPLSAAGETVTFEHTHKPVAPDETPLPPAAPDITSFAPNTGSGDDNITSEKELTISGTAPTGTHVTLLCDGAVIKEGIQVSRQGQWSTQWNTGKDGSFTLTAKASSDSATSAPSSAFSVQVDSGTPALEFDNQASDDNYNFVTYNKAAVITGTATPGLTFTLTQGNNSWDVTADDKGTWSQAVANLNDRLTEFSASSVSDAGVEVHKTAKLLVQSTPYDFQIQPDTGISDTDAITNSEDLLLTVKSQPDATVVLTILGKDLESTVNKDGLAEFPITLAGDNAYTCQLKTIYTNNEGESDTVEETITLDTTPAIINLDQLQSIYKDPDVSFTGQCDENGSTVSIKLVNVFKPEVSVSTTATVENGVFRATATVPEQGQYRAEVSVVDLAGNASNPQDYPFEYQPPKPELIIQTRPDDSSTNANPEWTGTFPHEGKLQISFAGKTDTITVQADNTWSYQFSEAFDSGRHTVTFTGTQAGLPGSATEQDSFTVAMPEMQLTIDDAPAENTNLILTEWKGSGAAPDAKVTLTLTPTEGDVVEQTVDADDQGLFTIALKLNEGSYSTALTATASGYQGASLTGSNVTIDRTGPVLLVDPGFKPTAGTCIMTGAATDHFGKPEPVGSVIVKLDNGQSYHGSIKGGQFSVELINLAPNHTYKAEITGKDGLSNAGTTKLEVLSIPSQPATALQLSKEPDSHTNDNLLQWEGTATPGATVSLTLTTATGQPVSKEVTADASGFFVFSETVAGGQYTASLSAAAADHQPATLPDKAITVDQTGPALTIDPNFQLTAGPCTLTGKALDQNGLPESQGTVTVEIPGIQKSFTGTISNGDFSVQINGLKPARAYQLQLSATDELQNVGQSLDTSYTTPALPVTDLQLSRAPDSHTNDDLLQWEGTATPGATVSLTLTTATSQPVSKEVTADASGFFVFSETVAGGQYTASLSADAADHQPATLPDKAITVDQTGPALTIDPNFQLTAGTCTLTGKALDQNGLPESQGTVTVKIPSIQKSFTGTISNGDFSVQINGLKPARAYQLQLSATDELQNTSFLDKSYTTPALPTPVTYDFAVTSDLNTDTKSIVLKGTHPLPRGRVQLKLTGDHVNTIDKNSGIITGRAKSHEWSIELNNLLLKQKAQVSLHAMDDAAKAQNAKLLPNVPELQETLVVDGDARDSSIGNLKALSGAGVYGHHIVMYAAKCSGKCNNKDGLAPWKVELTSPVQPGAKVLVTLDTVTVSGKPQKIQDRPYIKTIKLDGSGKAILEQPLDYTKKGNLKIDLSKEHLKPATIRFKAEGLEHNEEVFFGVETPSLHYTFDNIQPKQDTLVSQTYPAHAKISGSVSQVQGSIGSGLQLGKLGKGALQIQDFKDLFNDSYTICFDIKTSAKALTSNQPYPALAGYYDQTSNTGAKTHLFGAFNEKGQIGVADHNSGYFAKPVVADGQWHSVCISRNLVNQSMSTYRMLIDGKQAEISKDGSTDTGKEALMVHGTILNSSVSEYPIELLGGVTKSDSPDKFEYLDAVLDNFTAYPINMEIPYESSAYAHVHWHCPDGDICFYKSEFPAGLMINEIMGSKLTHDCSLYLQLQPDVSNKSLGTSFTVKYKGTDLNPQDASPAGDNVYKLDDVSAENLATLTVQPADPEAAHKFELHFDRKESDLIRGAGKDVSMPDGIIKFDSSASPLGSGISFGVGKEQSYSPSEGDPDCILEDRHLVTEPGTIINNYDINYSTIIDLNGLKALKILTQESDMSGKLHQLMSEGSAQKGTEHQVQLQDPCKLKDPSCTDDPLVTINTVDNNPAIALSLDGQITYYQHT